jgi:hypothetical protein
MVAGVKAIEDMESGAYRSRWRDGTLDLFGGIGVLAVGVSWWIDLVWLPAAFVPLLIILWSAVRRRVVEPRIGRVTFSRERRERESGSMKGAVWLGAGLLLLVLVVVWVQRAGGLAAAGAGREWSSAIPVGLLGLMALVAAVVTGSARFAGYGVLLACVGVAGVLLGLEPVPQILIGGAIVTLAGGTLLFRFIAAHPARTEGGAG